MLSRRLHLPFVRAKVSAHESVTVGSSLFKHLFRESFMDFSEQNFWMSSDYSFWFEKTSFLKNNV